MKFDSANVSFCVSLYLYMSEIGKLSISQHVRIIHLGECSVANPNLKKSLVNFKYIICRFGCLFVLICQFSMVYN